MIQLYLFYTLRYRSEAKNVIKNVLIHARLLNNEILQIFLAVSNSQANTRCSSTTRSRTKLTCDDETATRSFVDVLCKLAR